LAEGGQAPAALPVPQRPPHLMSAGSAATAVSRPLHHDVPLLAESDASDAEAATVEPLPSPGPAESTKGESPAVCADLLADKPASPPVQPDAPTAKDVPPPVQPDAPVSKEVAPPPVQPDQPQSKEPSPPVQPKDIASGAEASLPAHALSAPGAERRPPERPVAAGERAKPGTAGSGEVKAEASAAAHEVGQPVGAKGAPSPTVREPAVTAQAASPAEQAPARSPFSADSAASQIVEAPSESPRAMELSDPRPRTALSMMSQAAVHATAAIAAQVVKRLEGQATRFEMALTPEELGRVDVSLEIDADGQLAARLAFDNPLAAVEFRGRADELRRQLEDAGFRLTQDSLQFSEREGSGQRRDFGEQARRAFAGGGRLSEEADLAAPRFLALSLQPDRLDLRV